MGQVTRITRFKLRPVGCLVAYLTSRTGLVATSFVILSGFWTCFNSDLVLMGELQAGQNRRLLSEGLSQLADSTESVLSPPRGSESAC